MWQVRVPNFRAGWPRESEVILHGHAGALSRRWVAARYSATTARLHSLSSRDYGNSHAVILTFAVIII